MLAVPGILLVLICLTPFLNKAFTIDDPCFLLEARQILHDPLQPMSFPICWSAQEICVNNTSSFGIGSAQALMGYAMVPVILAGGAEWVAHTIQILLCCLAVFEMVRLAVWLGCSRLLAGAAGLLLAAIPPFLPMASTAMPDILALGLGLTGIERLFAWKAEGRWPQGVLSGIALGLAPFARPHWAMILGLASISLFDEFKFAAMRRQIHRQTRLWAPILLGVCILVAVNLATRHRGPTVDHIQRLTEDAHPYRNLFSYFLYLAVPIPITVVWLAAYWRKLPFLLTPVAAAAGLMVPMHLTGGLASQWALLAVLCVVPVVIYFLRVNWKSHDRTGLLLGFWMLSPLPAVAYVHFPIKYMVLALPAVVLIILRTLSSFYSATGARCVFAAIALAGTTYSCLILKADADLAENGRRAAKELIAPHVAAGEKVWYGGQWGFYWYAHEAGAEVSKPGVAAQHPGQLLVVGLMENGDVTRDRFPKRVLVDRRQYNSPHGRTMGSGAGLYSNLTGFALWVWNPGAKNVYELWRIQ